MNYYELTYLIFPDLSEEELKNFSEKINDFIQKEAGKIEKTVGPFKKGLGYPIKKKEGAFEVSLDFSFNPDKLEDLEKKLKSENQILRYSILTKKAPEKVSTKEFLFKKEKSFKITRKTPETKKVELEEIDKKIKEILGE